LIDSTPLEVSARDVLLATFAVIASLFGLYLAYLGLRGIAIPRRYAISEPQWGSALSAAGLGILLSTSFVLTLTLTAGEDPNTPRTVRTIAGAHAWSVRLALGGGAIVGIGFILLAMPPTIAAWLRQRRRRACGEPDPESPPFARPRRRPRRNKDVQPATKPRRRHAPRTSSKSKGEN